MWTSLSNDDEVRRLSYKTKSYVGEIWGTTGDAYMQQATIGKKLVADNRTLRKGGARPLCYFNNFPLIKMHPWAPVVFNSGGGVNGFTISWKSAQIAADLILNRRVLRETGVMWQNGQSWSYM